MTGVDLNLDAVTNVALGRAAIQSSRSSLSGDAEAPGATNGAQADLEPRPWWQLDLQTAHPIEAIVVHAAGIVGAKVLTSVDGGEWRLVHTVADHFGGAPGGRPLVIRLNGSPSRFIRIEGPQGGCIHLDEVEVYVAHAYARLPEVFASLGADPVVAAEKAAQDPKKYQYALSAPVGAGSRPEVRALTAVRYGRLGNNLFQLINLCHAGRVLQMQQVFYAASNIFTGDHDREGDFPPLSFLAEVRPEPLSLVGNYFYPDPLRAVNQGLTGPNLVESLDRVRGIFWRQITAPPALDDAAVVHLRAGDVFNSVKINPKFVQPPLSFYLKAIEHAVARHGIRRVVLLFEDRGNPNVTALEQALESYDLEVEINCGELDAAIQCLLSARILISSNSSFVEALAMMSLSLQEFYYFRELALNLNFNSLEALQSRRLTIFEVADVGGRYTPDWHWRASPDQLELMMRYPASALGEPRLVLP